MKLQSLAGLLPKLVSKSLLLVNPLKTHSPFLVLRPVKVLQLLLK